MAESTLLMKRRLAVLNWLRLSFCQTTSQESAREAGGEPEIDRRGKRRRAGHLMPDVNHCPDDGFDFGHLEILSISLIVGTHTLTEPRQCFFLPLFSNFSRPTGMYRIYLQTT